MADAKRNITGLKADTTRIRAAANLLRAGGTPSPDAIRKAVVALSDATATEMQKIVDYVNNFHGDGIWIAVDGTLIAAVGPDEGGRYPVQQIPWASQQYIYRDARGHILYSPSAASLPGSDRRQSLPANPGTILPNQDRVGS